MKNMLCGAVALILCAQASHIQAQVLVPPSNPDIYWYTAFPASGWWATIAGINTAMIDYKDPVGACGRPFGTLMVSDYYGNNTPGGISFRDACSGYTVDIPYPFGGSWFTNSPDIIVGNTTHNDAATDYVVAAAFANNIGSDQIDYWNVHYTGPYTFTVKYITTTFITALLGSTYTIHLDVIAEAGNTGLTGLPLCDRFVVTWEDGANNIWAYEGSLNAPPATINYAMSTLINPGVPGTEPDVAAIQRKVGGIDDVAMITWTDGTNIYYNEWDVTTSAIGVPVTLGPPLAVVSRPRIDGPDDYTINTPSGFTYPGPGFSYNKIVADVGNTAMTFDSYYGAGAWTSSSVVAVGSPHYAPSVAYGANGGTQYAVAHTTRGVMTNYTYMEPIDWLNPTGLALSPGAAYDYFLVNTNGINGSLFNFENSVSTPCNNPSDRTLVAWVSKNMGSGTFNDDVFYKLTDYTFVAPFNGYSFKHGTTVPALAKEWAVYPNPATELLSVDAPAPGYVYSITDVEGRTILQGDLKEGSQSIDINSLVPGSYVISMYKDGERSFNTVIVKK